MNHNYVSTRNFENFVGTSSSVSLKSNVPLMPSSYLNFNEYSASSDLWFFHDL